MLITRAVRKSIVRGESRSISALVCTRFGFIPTIYLPRLSSTLIEEHEGKRERAILRAIDEALESVGLSIVLRESKSTWEGLIRVARIVFRAINQRDLISRCDGEKCGRATRFAVTLLSFPSHSVSTVMSGRRSVNILDVKINYKNMNCRKFFYEKLIDIYV